MPNHHLTLYRIDITSISNFYDVIWMNRQRYSLLAVLWKSIEWLGTAPKLFSWKWPPNNVIEGGESENRDPGARARVLYATVNSVLRNSKTVKKHPNGPNLVSNASSRRNLSESCSASLCEHFDIKFDFFPRARSYFARAHMSRKIAREKWEEKSMSLLVSHFRILFVLLIWARAKYERALTA